MNEENQDTTATVPAVAAVHPSEQEVIDLTDETHQDVVPDAMEEDVVQVPRYPVFEVDNSEPNEADYLLTKDAYLATFGTPFDNGIGGPWKDYFLQGREGIPPRQPNGQPFECLLCQCDIEGDVFFCSENCNHRLCPTCTWNNIKTSRLPEGIYFSGFKMAESARCSFVFCNGDRRNNYYAQNYCPFRPPTGEYVYGHIGYYPENTPVNPTMPRQLVWNMPITSPGMWNVYTEIYWIVGDKPYIPNVRIESRKAIDYLLYLQKNILHIPDKFTCNMCNVPKDLVQRVNHPGCAYACANKYMCMVCACKIDKGGRQKALSVPTSSRFLAHGNCRMNRLQEISWQCPKCNHESTFKRIDDQPLNTVARGLYGVRAMNELNAYIRSKIRDKHETKDLPLLLTLPEPIAYVVNDSQIL